MSIRDTFFENKAVGALWDVAVSIKRGNPLPLDSNSVFESYAALETYAAGVLAYPGQIVAVVNEDSTGIYYLDQNLAINEVGKIPAADNKSIEIADGVIAMHDYGTSYYKYVPEEKNPETEEIIKPASYEKVDVAEGTPWKAGLEPRVVSENGELVIGWFEPNPTTIDGVQDQVVAVQGTVNDLDEQLNKEGGLVDQVEEIQEEIGHAATEAGDAATGLYAELDKKADVEKVYTKEQADALLNNKADANKVYTKEETNTKIAEAVSAADHLKRKIVENKAAIETYIEEHEDADQYIFMVPTAYSYSSESNKYDEYIVLVSEGEDNTEVYTIEPVGSWAVDLEDYVSEEELTKALESYYKGTDIDELLEGYVSSGTLETELGKYYLKTEINTILADYYTVEEIDIIISDMYNKATIDSKFNNYHTAETVNNLLNEKVDKVDGKNLVLETEIAKLSTVKENAEPNFVKSISDRFTITEGGQLGLKAIGVKDVDNLENILKEKVDKVYYTVDVVDEDGNPVYEEDGVTPKTEQVEGSLLSPDDKKKLDILVVGDNGNIEISGKVNASNVEGLGTWITNNRDGVAGLFSSIDKAKLDSLENYITSVEETHFTVVEGKLSLKETFTKQINDLNDASGLHSTKITNLENLLNGYTTEEGQHIEGLTSKVDNLINNTITVADFEAVVGNLAQMKEQNVNIWADVQALQEAMKWQTMN